MTTQIVVLAAGKGTRMGVDVPKVLLPLNGKPLIANLLQEIEKIPQETKPIVVVGFKKELVMETLGSDYLYVTQFDQKGTAHAVLSVKDIVTADSIIVLNGDMPFTKKESLEKLIELHEQNNSMVSMFTVDLQNFEGPNEHFVSWGRIIRNKANEIVKVREYKDASDEQKLISEVNTGTYMFNSAWVWEQLEKIGSENAQGEYYLTDIIELAMKDGHQINSLVITPNESYGINNPNDLEFARNLVD